MIERRVGMEELKESVANITIDIQRIRSYLESEFGGQNVLGQHTEGNVNRNFRELKTELSNIEGKVDHQNGRVKKLEMWKVYILGAGASASFIFGSLITIWLKK